MHRKKVKERRLAIKFFLCIVYLIVITILFVCSYRLFQEKQAVLPFREVEDMDNYTYIDIYKMSEKFAYYEDTNVGVHFVIDKEKTGVWHTYIIAINEDKFDDFKAIIDYTYGKTDKIPDPIRVYGYPTLTTEEMRAIAIKNIANFVPSENEVIITEENYNNYLTNSYLDTTQPKKEKFSIVLCISLILLFLVIVLFVMTVLDQDKMVDNFDNKLEEVNKIKKKFQKSQKE